MELHNVTDIFERINTMGKILSTFDLLIARLSRYEEIKLRDLWEETIKRFPKIKSYDKLIGKLPVYIIQSMSLCYNKNNSCKKADILNIYELAFESTDISFEDTWFRMSQYIDNAISKLENMRDGFGVKDETELPFGPMIPILAALLKEIDTYENKIDPTNKLKMWYWSSVFSNAYSSAVESQLTLDFKDMKDWFNDNNKIPRTVEKARKEIITIDLRQVQVKSSAIYRGVLSLIALKGAKDLGTNLTLENARNNHRDHVFPRKEFDHERNVNSVLNMTWISDETNLKKSDKRPSQFCKSFIDEKYSKDEEEFKKVLETHYISSSAYECMLQDDFEGFVTNREAVILTEINDRMGLPSVPERTTLISPEKPFGNSRIMSDTIRACDGYIHWIDKYFSNEGLNMIYDSVDKNKVNSIKILTSIANTNIRLRQSFERLKKEFKNENIECELRVITDRSRASKIHDRWILSKNANFNIPSPDVVARGQYSEVKKTNNSLPFTDMWENSLDIISDWTEIEKIIQYANKKNT
jgi:hypothetical protein